MVKSKSAIHSVNLFHDWLLEYTYIDNVCLLNKNTFYGTRYLSHCCSLHGTVLLSRR